MGELHETEYGERQYGVEDLDGHRWLSRNMRETLILNSGEQQSSRGRPISPASSRSVAPPALGNSFSCLPTPYGVG
jgi:hypothetical protein